MAYIKNNQFVPEVETPSFSLPRVTVPKLQVPELKLPLKSLVPKQERRHVDDFGDVFLGNPFTGTLELRHTLRDAGLAEWEYVPILNRFIGAGLMIKERTIDPLRKGDIGGAFINYIESMGKTMDTLANPVKSLFSGAGGGEPNSFAKSMGWVENSYRKDYQWNTGFFLSDLVLEILSDPTTYLSLGASAVAKTTNAVDDTMKLTRKAIAAKYGADAAEELSDETIKTIIKWISDDLTKASSSEIMSYLKNIINVNQMQLADIIKKTPKNSLAAKRLEALSKLHVNTQDPRAIKKFLDTVQDVKYAKPYKIYNTINKTRNFANQIDRALFIAGTGLSPVMGVGAIIMKYGVTSLFKHLWTNVVLKKPTYDLASDFTRVTRSIEEVHQELAMKNRLAKDVFKKFNKLFEKYDIDSEKLQRIWVNIYNRTPNTANKLLVVQNEFLDRLVKAMPELGFILDDELKFKTIDESLVVKEFLDKYNIKNHGAIVADELYRNINKETVSELVSAVAESSLVELGYTEKVLLNYKNTLEKSIRAFSTDIGIPLAESVPLKDFDVLVNLLYVRENIFHNKFSPDEILKVLNNPNLDSSERMFLNAILDFVGVNADNATQVSTLLNKILIDNHLDPSLITTSNSKDIETLKKILIKGRTGALLLSDDIKTTSKVIKDTIGNITSELKKYKNTLNEDQVVKLFKEKATIPNIDELVNKQNKVINATEQLDKLQKAVASVVGIPDVNNENLDLVLNDLDKLFDAGTDFQDKLVEIADTANESNSSIVRRVLMFDLDKASIDSLKEYTEAVQNLQRKVKTWVQQIRNTTDVVLPTTKQFIYTLNDVLNNTPMQDVISDFINIVNHHNDLYSLMVSARGRYNILNMELAAQLSEKNRKLFNAIGDPNSTARRQLETIISVLRGNPNTQYAAELMNQAIAIMNAHDFIAVYLNSPLTSYVLSKEANEFLQGNMFNVLYNLGNKDISYLYTHLDGITEKYLQDVDKFVKPLLDDNVHPLFNTEKWYEEFRDEIGRNFKSALQQYHNNIGKLAESLGTPLKIFNDYNQEAVAVFNTLGLQYENVIDALIQNQVDLSELEVATDFINYVSGSNMRQAIDTTQDIIKGYIHSTDISKDYKKVLEQLDELVNVKLSKNLTNESLAWTITNAFKDINTINEWLGGADAKIGRVLTGTKGNRRMLKNIISYMDVQSVNDYINKNTKLINVFGYSTAHPLLGFKKAPAAKFITKHKLNVKNFWFRAQDTFDNLEYNRLIANYEGAYKIVQDYAAKSPKRADVLRQALYTFFLENELSWGPRAPKTYFLNPELTIDELYAWDYLIMSGAMDRVKSQNYLDLRNTLFKERDIVDNTFGFVKGDSLSKRYEYINSPIYLTDGIEQIANDNFIKDNAYDRYIDVVTGPQWEHLDSILERDLGSFMKDQESMKMFEYTYTQYIKQDKDAMHKLRPIVELEQDKRPIARAIKDKQVVKYLKSRGVKYMNDTQLQSLAFKERTEALSDAIKSMTAKQLRSYVDTNTPGFMIFVNDNPRDLLFQFSSDELKNAGLYIQQVPDAKDIWLIRRTNTDTVWVPYTYKKEASLIKDIQQTVTKAFKDNNAYFNWGTIDVPEELFTGQMMSKTYLDAIKQHPTIASFLGNLRVQKSYLKLDENNLDTFFTKEISRPNFTIVGVPNAFNRVIDYAEDTFRALNIEPWYYSTRLDRSAYAGSISAIKRVNTEHKYLQLWFNDDFALGGSVFKPILDNATDEELSKLFRRNEYAAVVLKQDKNGMPRVYKIFIDNHKQLEAAVQQGAICVPHEVYRNMYLAINKRVVDNKLIRLYRQTIVGTFKSIYLTSAGYLMRNFIDSAIIKNASSTDGMLGLLDNFKYEYRALKDLEWYDKIQQEVLKLSKAETGSALFNRNYLQAVLAKYTKEERDKYRLLDLFINSSASSGPSKTLSEFLVEYNMKQKPYEGYNWELWLNKNLQEGKYSPVHLVQNINDKIETASRYGLFLKTLETQDSNVARALKKVVETHFDYALKDNGLDLLEQFFWFSTFPINNMFYYLNDGLLNNPDILKLQLDAIEQSYNNEDISWDDIRNSDYLTRNLMTGNLIFRIKDKKIVLKTGSSLFDLMNILLNPVGEAGERLNPFMSVLFGLEGLSELNPTTAQINRFKQIQKWYETNGERGSAIPSVYATMYPKRNYRAYYPKVYNNLKGSWNFKPKRKYLPKPRTYYLGLLSRPRYTRTRYSYLNKINGPAGTTYAIGAQPDVVVDKTWKVNASPVGYKYRDGIKKHIETLRRADISQTKKRH